MVFEELCRHRFRGAMHRDGKFYEDLAKKYLARCETGGS